MEKQISFSIDGQRIRFTPDGRVAILDAIGALCDMDDSQRIWPKMLSQWPQLSNVFSLYRFDSRHETPVATPDAWDEIETRLLDYIVA
ncbi:MAG: hypothetical protein P8X55_18885 [Desulfosarcinaceae bacterium]